MSKTFKYLVCCSIVLMMIVLPACVQETETIEEKDTEMVAEPQTEEEYRAAIAKLGKDKTFLETSRDYYLELRSMEAFTEKDYLALSNVYEALGDTAGMRETLIDMHRHYPSKENVQKISDVIVEKGMEDVSVSKLVDNVLDLLEKHNFSEVTALIETSEWQQEMQDALVGVCRRTRYTGTDYVVQIISNEYETEIEFLKEDTSFWYFRCNGSGVIAGNTMVVDGKYEGAYDIFWFDTEENQIKICQGTFLSDISVGELTVEYDGNEYKGSLDDRGNTLEKQNKKITDAGGVIYAYDDSKDKYLYEENCTVETLVFNNEYLGLPKYEKW